MIEFWFINLKLVVSLLVILVMFRFIGRKVFAENTPIDMVFMVILGGVVSILVTGNDYTILETAGIVLFWGFLIFVIETLKMNYKGLKGFLLGSEDVIVRNGKINQTLMDREQMTEDELMAQLREKGVFSLDEVKVAYLEISGNITVKKRSENE